MAAVFERHRCHGLPGASRRLARGIRGQCAGSSDSVAPCRAPLFSAKAVGFRSVRHGGARLRTLRMASAVFALLAPPFASLAGGADGGLFGTAAHPVVSTGLQAVEMPTDDLALRTRAASIDFDLLERARTSAARGTDSATLRLNLFDDAAFTGVVKRTAPTFSGGYSLSGGIAGDPLGSVTLVVNGGTVAGTVRTVQGTYRIRSAGSGRYAISEVDRSTLGFECEVVE